MLDDILTFAVFFGGSILCCYLWERFYIRGRWWHVKRPSVFCVAYGLCRVLLWARILGRNKKKI